MAFIATFTACLKHRVMEAINQASSSPALMSGIYPVPISASIAPLTYKTCSQAFPLSLSFPIRARTAPLPIRCSRAWTSP
jgi:hypothetical protein